MANLILSIGFLEANSAKAIKGLCGYAGLAESEANAKAALKQLADETVNRVLDREAAEKARAERGATL
jgi:hypothetical protein